MKFLPLVWAALRRRPLRSVLTVLAVAVAFLLFGVMHGVIASFDGALTKITDTRLRVMSRANLLEPLPLAYRDRILRIPGVRNVSYATFMLGHYQDPKNGVIAAGLDVESFLDVFNDFKIPPDQRKALAATRTGAVIGVVLAKRYGWKLGDRVTIESPQWIKNDGTSQWTFDIVAIANAGPDDDKTYADELFFHYQYLDEARIYGKGSVHQFIVAIDDPKRTDAIAQAIDKEFANSAAETTTLNDREYVRAQIAQIGDIRFFVNAILGAVLFTLLFLTGNTMMQSVRERIPELAVLKSVGFSERLVLALVVVESFALAALGAALGLAISAALMPVLFKAIQFGDLSLPKIVYFQGLGVAALLAAVVATVPAWRARNLSIVDALAGR